MKNQVVDLRFKNEDDAFDAKELILGFKTTPNEITNNGKELRLLFDDTDDAEKWFEQNEIELSKLPNFSDIWEDEIDNALFYDVHQRGE